MSAATNATAPRLARALVALAAPRDEREHVLGDLEEELALHVRERGRRAARRWYWRQALASLPHLLALRAARPTFHREASPPMWRGLPEDVRLAARRALARPLTSAVVVATAVLAIAVTTAVFSVVNAVLLRPLPFPDAERVVQLGTVLRSGARTTHVAWPDVQDYRRDVRAFEAITATSMEGAALTQGDAPRRLDVLLVDGAWPSVYGVRPALGRFFTDAELREGGARVAVLSWALWREAFGGDSAVVGRTVSLDARPYAIVGVLPPSVPSFPWPRPDVVAPLVPRAGSYQMNRGALWLAAAAKLRSGASLERARAEVDAEWARLIAAYPDAYGGLQAYAEPLRDAVVGDVRRMLALLAAAVAAVLLVAGVNTANLLLAQSLARGREFAVRAAIGGTPWRIRRQLLTESTLLAAAGGPLGVALAPGLTRLLVTLYPGDLPRAAEIGVDARVLLAGAAATLLVGALAGLPTARRAGAPDLGRDLSGGRASESRRQRGLGRALVVAQIALSLALVFAAGLLLRTLDALSRVDPGFVADGVTAFQVAAPPERFRGSAGQARFFEAVRSEIARIPGVERVASGTDYPLGGGSWLDVFVPEERGDRGQDNPQVRFAAVSAGYPRTLGVPLLRGRALDARDGEQDAPRAVVVNDALARRFYPGQDPVGRRLSFDGDDGWEIVGVVGSMRMRTLVDPPEPELYLPEGRHPQSTRYVLVKSRLAAQTLLPQLRAAVRDVDPTVALTGATTLDEQLAEATAPQRFRAALVGGLGGAALLLAALGLYGLIGHAVSRRTREIGVRIALGAEAGRVRGLVVADAARLALGGTALGALLALGAGRWLSGFLVGVSGHDVPMLAAAAGTMLVVAVVAAFVPARRASRVDAVTVLRGE